MNFTFSLAFEQRTLPAVGALWTVLLFAMILGLGPPFALQQENGGGEGPTSSPVDPAAASLAKPLLAYITPSG